jgi:hypothetical protein
MGLHKHVNEQREFKSSGYKTFRKGERGGGE